LTALGLVEKFLTTCAAALCRPACFLLLLGGWMIASTPAGFWTLFVLLLFLLPVLLAINRGIDAQTPGNERGPCI